MNRKFALVLLTAALSSQAEDLKTPRVFGLDLKPGKVHEECLTIDKGKSIDFEWSSTQLLDFNIHFHKGNEVSYPVRVDNVKVKKGRFSPGAKEDYCWMWTAKVATKLTGKLSAAK